MLIRAINMLPLPCFTLVLGVINNCETEKDYLRLSGYGQDAHRGSCGTR